MATYKLVLALLLSSCLVYATICEENSDTSQRSSQQCRLQKLTASQPSRKIQHEAGQTELWDENDDQFQCAGVAPMRNTLEPNGLSLPNFQPAPRLVYIERGQGLLGIIFPGCPETYHSGQQGQQEQREQQEQRGQEEKREHREQEGQQEKREQEGQQGKREQEGQHEKREQREQQQGDQHQKIHRIRQGDIVALPAGAAHWFFNDGNEQLVGVSITNLNHHSNHLDQTLRALYFAGGERKGQQTHNFYNFFPAFDKDTMADAYNVDTELIQKMQRQDDRGFIVNAKEMRGIIRPDFQQSATNFDLSSSSVCSMQIRTNIDNNREADIYSRQAGKLNLVNKDKLPILNYIDMSAERGQLLPDALVSPHWSMNGHSIYYATKGQAHIQIVDQTGQRVMNDRVNQGDMFVIPQYFVSTIRAGKKGFEWVNLITTGSPSKSTLVGYTSVMRAMPLQLLSSAYQISLNEAQQIKMNRGGQSYLLSPLRRSSSE